MVPLVIALGVGAMLPWKRGDLAALTRPMTAAFVFAVAVTALAAIVVWTQAALALIGIAMAAWLAAATAAQLWLRARPRAGIPVGEGIRRMLRLPRAAWGMSLAHLGVAVVIAGATGASLLTQETIAAAEPGDSFRVGAYTVTLQTVESVDGPNYRATRGTFRAVEAETGDFVATLSAERRRYVAGGEETTEAGIRTSGLADLYAVLGQPTGNGTWTVRLYVKPLVPWLWVGSLLMVFGGALSLADRRLRIGAPKRSGTKAADGGPAPQPAE